MNYSEFSRVMRKNNEKRKEEITGYVVVSNDSFKEKYSLESRTYIVSSNNKAYKEGMLGYSIFAYSLDGSDFGIRLEGYLREEKGGENGWIVSDCYFINKKTNEKIYNYEEIINYLDLEE